MRESAKEPDVLLTTKEAARRLGVQRSSMEGWRLKGGGPVFIRLSSRCIRYRQSDLDKFIEQRLRRSTSDCGEPRRREQRHPSRQ